MAVRLHADDLGLHPAVDRAIFRAFEAGALGGASILATGPTFREAARQARSIGLPLALHLAIVDTAPLSPPAEVPSLLDSDSRFPPYPWPVIWRSLYGGLRRAELRLELGRQLQTFAEAGLISQPGLVIDGHQHLHLLPVVFETVLGFTIEYGIVAFRLPLRSPHERRQRRFRSFALAGVEALGRRASRLAARRAIAPVRCWGVLCAGHLTLQAARCVLSSLPSGADGQLLCHPGDDDRALAAVRSWGYEWETELATALALASESRP
jgi:predicted glycoside hydrolase/deacetylase ChbG (UPF0249 family)